MNVANQYLSYNIEVYDANELYTCVYSLNVFGITRLKRVYQHTLEVISQRFDKLEESDGSLSLAELTALYGLPSTDNDIQFSYEVNAHERGRLGMRYVVRIYPVTVFGEDTRGNNGQ